MWQGTAGRPLWGSKELPARNQGPQGNEFCQQSKWAWKWILSLIESKWESNPGNPLIAALWDTKQGIQLSCAWTLDSWNHEIMIHVVLSHRVCCNLLHSHRKRIQIPLIKIFPISECYLFARCCGYNGVNPDRHDSSLVGETDLKQLRMTNAVKVHTTRASNRLNETPSISLGLTQLFKIFFLGCFSLSPFSIFLPSQNLI